MTMQVYVEYALAENFCMDFVLLACAKFASKNRCGYLRLAIGSALGACFAVAFPLFGLSGFWSVAVKILSGLALGLSGRVKPIKSYIKFTAAFLAFSALLGGLLIAIFSLAGMDYAAGQGYILSSVPVGIPLFAALVLAFVVRRVFRRLAAKYKRTELKCIIYVGDKSVEQTGFFDSGNKVYCGGAPVSVIPLSAACALVDVSALREGVRVNTVAGSRLMKIFTADKIEIYNGENLHTIKYVKIGISPRVITRAVLHPDLAEECGDV